MSSGRVSRLFFSLMVLCLSQAAFGAPRAYVDNRVREAVQDVGRADVIIQMGDASQPKIWAADWRQRVAPIRSLAERVISAAPKMGLRRTYDIFPFLAAAVEADTLDTIAELPEVEAVYPDRRMRAVLNQSGPLVGQPAAELAGRTGAGIGVAVLDTGVDYTHPFFSTPEAKFFLDLHPGHWAWRFVEAVAEAGVVGGYADQTYRPADPVTRDQMAVFIARAVAGGDANVPAGPATPTFTDVPDSYWAYKYVEYCKAEEIAGGYSDGTYRPTQPVTRGQMAVFIARALAGGDASVPPGPGAATFLDVPTDHWAFKYVEYVQAEGVVGGYSDGTYRPDTACTRDQMSVFVSRAFDYTWGGRVIGGVNILAQTGTPGYTDATDPMDDYGHGTMVGGVVASMNATYRGIAPGANLLAVKALDDTGGGWSSDTIAGIEWCIQNQAAFNIRAINLSLGDGSGWSDPEVCDAQPEGIAITEAVEAGMLVAVASGNEAEKVGLQGLSLPACASDATSVGATNDGGPEVGATPVDGVSAYGDRGELLTMYAPGTWITTAYPDSQTATADGTSFAAPHVAGAAAILAQMGVTDPREMKSRLARTGVQIIDATTNVASPRLDLVTAMAPPTSGRDLIVTAVSSAASSAAVGDSVPLSLTVRNQGNQASTACTAVIVLSANKISSRQDHVLATVTIPVLSASQTYTVSPAPTGTVPVMNGGQYYLGAHVDSGYAVAEINEVNNALTNTGATFTVIVPSAVAVGNTLPSSLRTNQSALVTVVMMNDGALTWTPGEYCLGSVGPEGNSTWGLSTVPLSSTVGPGGTATFSFTITAPSSPGSYSCCWRMRQGSSYFGEVVISPAKDLVVDDAVYGQDYPAVSADRVAFMDYTGQYSLLYDTPEISVKNETSGLVTTLIEDIPGLISPGGEWPVSPYDYFDLSYHYFPSIAGSWVSWMVDDVCPDPWGPEPIWYFNVVAYDLSTPAQLPRRVTLQYADAWLPTVDQVPAASNHYCVVWEDYRNDPDKLASPYAFLSDNSDIYLSDVNVITDATNHRTAVYPICTAPGPQFAPRISGNLVVWEDWRDEMQSDIYLYDLSVDSDSDGTPNWKETVRPDPDPAERRLTNTAWAEGYPDISGRRVVYCDYSTYTGPGANVSIISENVDTLVQTPVITSPAAFRQRARIDGTQVVWEDWRSGECDVYWADLANFGVPLPIAAGIAYEGVPDIADARLVYAKYRAGAPPSVIYNVYYQRLTPYLEVTP